MVLRETNIIKDSFSHSLKSALCFVQEPTQKPTVVKGKTFDSQQIYESNTNPGKLIITGCTFKKCSAENGAGLKIFQDCLLTIHGSIFTECESKQCGGAAYICRSRGTLTYIDDYYTEITDYPLTESDVQYCCFDRCFSGRGYSENSNGYGPNMIIVSTKVTLSYISSSNHFANKPYNDKARSGVFDVQAEDVSIVHLNVTEGFSRLTGALDIRRAQSGHVKFQTFDQVDCQYLESFLYTSGVDAQHANIIGNVLRRYSGDKIPSFVRARGSTVSFSNYSAVNREIQDGFRIASKDDDSGTITLINWKVYGLDTQDQGGSFDAVNVNYFKNNNDVDLTSILHLALGECGGNATVGPLIITPLFTKSDYFTFSQYFSKSFQFTYSNEFHKTDDFSSSDKFTKTGEFSKTTAFTDSGKFSRSDKFQETDKFSESAKFSKSDMFSQSTEFSETGKFSESVKFSDSVEFSDSGKFSRSDKFPETDKFSESAKFSKTTMFSQSTEFSETGKFSESVKFSDSVEFSDSGKFSRSDKFPETDKFSESDKFSKTTMFSKSSCFSETGDFTKSSFFSESVDFTKSHSFPNSFYFSQSEYFTNSKHFSSSSIFTNTNGFTGTSGFTKTDFFSLSFDFTKSDTFTESRNFNMSDTFTPSSCFTPSDFFSFSYYFSNSFFFSTSELFSKSNQFSESAKFSESFLFSKSEEFRPTDNFKSTIYFSKSNYFSKSYVFSKSSYFTKSTCFTQTNYFTDSNIFSDSNNFISFHPSSGFSESKPFSESQTLDRKPEIPVNIKIQTEESQKGITSGMKIGIGIGVGVVGAAAIAVLVGLLALRRRGIKVNDFSEEDIEIRETETESTIHQNPLTALMDNDDPFEEEFFN